MRSLRLLPLILCLQCVACGWTLRSLRWNTPDDRILHYEFETSHTLSTEVQQFPAGVDTTAAEPLLAKLADETFALGGRMEKFKAGYFDDGTSGLVLRLESVTCGPDGPDGASGVDTFGLIGKSVAMRVFDSGEVFETHGLEHLSGYGRFGELFADVFTQMIVRLPIEVPEPGAEVRVETRVPLKIDRFTRVERALDIVYRREGEPEPCLVGRACVQLTYEGRVAEQGINRDPMHFTEVEASGTISGSLLFALDKGDFQEHRYVQDIQRTIVTYEGPFDEGETGMVRARLSQNDRSETTLRRMP